MTSPATETAARAATNGTAPGCPWSDWMPQSADLFCEARLCDWVSTPANTWSNLGYVFVGVALVVVALRQPQARVRELASLGLMSVAVGIGSFFFHASATFVGEVCDVGAMFMLSTWALIQNVERWRGAPFGTAAHLGLYWGVTAASTALLVVLAGGGILIFTAQVTAVVLLELALLRQHRKGQRPPVSYRPMALLVLFFTAAFTCWTLDATKTWCDPGDHLIQGHAFWHLLNTPVYVCLYVFHRDLRRA